MAITPLSPSLANSLGSVQRPGTDAGRARVEHGQVRPTTTPATRQPARPGAPSIAAPVQSGLAAAAPSGTDPELWSVLTTEERSFFAKVGTMGPLTYGRMMQAPNAPPSIRGGRLDIKV